MTFTSIRIGSIWVFYLFLFFSLLHCLHSTVRKLHCFLPLRGFKAFSDRISSRSDSSDVPTGGLGSEVLFSPNPEVCHVIMFHSQYSVQAGVGRGTGGEGCRLLIQFVENQSSIVWKQNKTEIAKYVREASIFHFRIQEVLSLWRRVTDARPFPQHTLTCRKSPTRDASSVQFVDL